MHADLVRAAGLQFRFEKRQRWIVVEPRAAAEEDRLGLLALLFHAHAALAFLRRELVQRQPDAPLFVAPAAAHQHEIALVEGAFAQLRMQPDQRRRVSWRRAGCPKSRGRGDARVPGIWRRGAPPATARSALVRCRCRRGPPSPDGLSTAMSASSSNRIGNAGPARAKPAAGVSASCRRGRPHRRHAHHVAQGEPRVRSDAALVHADLAAAQDPVNVALRDAFQDLAQEIVDALASRVLANRKPADSILA